MVFDMVELWIKLQKAREIPLSGMANLFPSLILAVASR